MIACAAEGPAFDVGCESSGGIRVTPLDIFGSVIRHRMTQCFDGEFYNETLLLSMNLALPSTGGERSFSAAIAPTMRDEKHPMFIEF
jgi:hypothetical protein